ncbi:MAG: hypothetical protein IT531_12465 [Burkholderiales bacterium]|nr:hypothetical protein [Burkholderiales bacterium]
MDTHTSSARTALQIALLACLGSALAPIAASAQDLQPRSRTVFKCETDSATLYTDAPCAGSGKTDTVRLHFAAAAQSDRIEPELQANTPRDAHAEAAPGAGALEPRLRAQQRIASLAHTPQAECPHLSQRMALVEAEERTATSFTIRAIQDRLTVQRNRFRELGCEQVGFQMTLG